MLTHRYSARVSYSETDQMGFVHHSNYARFYENARWEMFRSMGINYAQIEEDGVLMPVVKMEARFIQALHYDEEYVIETQISKLPQSVLELAYIISTRERGIVHTAKVTLAFINKITQKACRPPVMIVQKLSTNL